MKIPPQRIHWFAGKFYLWVENVTLPEYIELNAQGRLLIKGGKIYREVNTDKGYLIWTGSKERIPFNDWKTKHMNIAILKMDILDQFWCTI